MESKLSIGENAKQLYGYVSTSLPYGLSIGSALLSVLAISTVHFAGFLSSIPSNLQQIVIVEFADTFIALFYFYVGISFVISKVVANVAFAFRWWFASVLRIFRKHESTSPTPDSTVQRALWSLHAIVFVLFFIGNYHETPYILASWSKDYLLESFLTFKGLIAAIAIVATIVFLFDWFCRLLSSLITHVPIEVENNDESSIRIGALVGIVLMVFYYSGVARGHYLWLNNPIVVQDGRIAGRFNVVLKSGGSMILVEHNSFFDRHLVLTPEAIFYEIVHTGEVARDYVYPWEPAYTE